MLFLSLDCINKIFIRHHLIKILLLSYSITRPHDFVQHFIHRLALLISVYMKTCSLQYLETYYNRPGLLRCVIYHCYEHTLVYGNDLQNDIIDYLLDGPEYQCHSYSHPYELPYYDGIGNNFPGGLFKCVRSVFLFGQGPFEQESIVPKSSNFVLMIVLSLLNV